MPHTSYDDNAVPGKPARSIFGVLPIIMILLLATAVRLIGLNDFPVWTDEGWTTWAVSEPTVGAVVDKVGHDRHPPGYFLLLAYWSRAAGLSRLAMRLPAALLGVLAVAATYRLGADVFGRTAIFGALLFAVTPVAVYYTQEIRHYGPLLTAVCLTSLLFLRVMARPSWPRVVAYGLSVSAAMYTLYFAAVPILVQVGVGLVFGTWHTRGRLLAAWAGAALTYAPWLVIIARYQLDILGGGITAAPGTFLSTPAQLLQLADLLFGGGVALLGGLYLLGAARALRPFRVDRLYVVLWGGGIFVALALLNIRVGSLSARTLVYITPALALVAAQGLMPLARPVRLTFTGIALAVMLITPPLIQPRLDYHRAAETVAAEYTPGDLVVLETGWDDNAFRYELLLALPPDAEVIRTLPWVNNRDGNEPVVPNIEAALRNAGRVWVVNWLQPSQVIPWLETSDAGFHHVLSTQSPVGEEYNARFAQFGALDDVRATLYARPPRAAEPRVFGETLQLHGARAAASVRTGETLAVDLFWSAVAQPNLDYSVGVFLLDDAGVVRAEHNAAPGQTSTWTPDGAVYTARFPLSIPPDVPPGEYDIAARVYWFAEPENPLATSAGESLPVVGDVVIR